MEHWNDVVLVPDSTLMIGMVVAVVCYLSGYFVKKNQR